MKKRGYLSWILAVALCSVLTACPPGTGFFDEGETDNTGNASEIRALEDEAFQLVNDERAQQGLAALEMTEELRLLAREHSQDMVNRNFFDHVNPDGDDAFDRMDAENIDYSAAAENIARNSGFSEPAGIAVEGWMDSPGHRTNILNGTYTQTGMGVAYSAANGYHFTQVFIRPQGQ